MVCGQAPCDGLEGSGLPGQEEETMSSLPGFHVLQEPQEYKQVTLISVLFSNTKYVVIFGI